MNIVNKLTLRQMKLNKKRTLVTMIGTIISAAMLTAVATLGFSFMDLMQRQCIAGSGEWHAIYENVNLKQLEAIKSDKRIKTAIMSKELGYAYLEGSQNTNKPYLFIKEYSSESFAHNPIHLLDGRLPVKPDELLISEDVRTNAKVNYSVGDVINLSIGSRISDGVLTDQKELNQMNSLIWDQDKVAESLTSDFTRAYTIVGIMERPKMELTWSPGYTTLSYIDENSVTSGEPFDVSVIFRKINNKLFSGAEEIKAQIGASNVDFNSELLRYYGIVKDDQIRNMLYIVTAVIMGIIMIGSISLIYNAFAISVSERSRYLGMLSSIGATRRQKRNSVFFEGAVIGAISIPIGIIAGYIGLAVTYIFINPVIKSAMNIPVGFRLKIFPVSLITAVVVSIATIMISAYIPARRASNVSAIDAIRQITDIKITGKQVRNLKITRKLFGIEGDLGLKNLKRNRGRYKATVFSLIISMVIFLVVSYFTDSLKKSVVMTQDGINFDIRTILGGSNAAENEEILSKITSLDNISEMAMIHTRSAETWINKAAIADYLKENSEYTSANETCLYEVTIDVLDDEALKKYTKEIGTDFSRLKDTANPSAIIIDTMKFKDKEADKYVETRIVKADLGEQLDLSVKDLSSGEAVQLKPVTIAAQTDIMPMGVMTLGKIAGFHLIMSDTVFNEIIKGKEDIALEGYQTQLYLNSDTPLRLQEEIEDIQNSYGNSSMSIFNVFQFRQREQQMLLLVGVFTYAFIILITAVSMANIINTISTGITLRKREFAMLKSVGITPKGFNRMLYFESIFYGIKALVYGLPISVAIMYLLHRVLSAKFVYGFSVSASSIITVIVAVFLIVGTAMLYSSRKVRKENIIDALKQEII